MKTPMREKWEGCPHLHPTTGFRERRKLPQRGPERNFYRERVSVHFELERIDLVIRNL